MSNFARIVDGSVTEVVGHDPAGRYPDDWVWEPCPADTQAGATWDGTDFSNPAPAIAAPVDPVPVPLAYPRFIALVRQAGGLSADMALSIMDGTHTSSEVKFIRALLLEATGPLERDDPLVQGGLDTLLAEGVLTQAGRDTIIAAWPTA
jgi:hypothetical protein